MITLQRLNVVKVVASEFEAEKLIRKGFTRYEELEHKEESDELKQLRERAIELGISRAGQLGEKKLREAIAEKEADQKPDPDGKENEGD